MNIYQQTTAEILHRTNQKSEMQIHAFMSSNIRTAYRENTLIYDATVI